MLNCTTQQRKRQAYPGPFFVQYALNIYLPTYTALRLQANFKEQISKCLETIVFSFYLKTFCNN